MKKLFAEQGSEIPVPHRTLYFGALGDGSAPPAFVQLDDRRPPPVPPSAGAAPRPAAPPRTPTTPDPDGGGD
jgi:hypothetical protein